MTNDYFGESIKSLRNERGMSQEELSLNVGTTKASISKYERGIQRPTLEVAKKIADFFGISLEELSNPNYVASDKIDAKSAKEIIGLDKGYLKAIRLAKANNIDPDELIKMMEFALNFRK